MKKSLCFLLALALVLWSPSSCAASSDQVLISSAELVRLNEIFTRLSTLNEKLNQELAALKASSNSAAQTQESLQREVETLRTELAQLRTELSEQRARSESLEASLTTSVEESKQLRELQEKAESSLVKASESFEAYKSEVEARINQLETERTVWAVIAFLVGLGIGFGGGHLWQ